MNANPISYRWQDHVVTSQRSTMNLMATALVVLAVGAAVMFSVVGSPTPPAPAAHAATERTPPLAQLAKRPIRPRATDTWR